MAASAAAEPAHEPLALVIVVDRASPQLEAVKAGIAGLITSLHPTDRLAVTAYGTVAQVVAPLQPIGRARAIARDVARLTAAEGTNLIAGIDAARKQLATTTIQRKRILIATNGSTLIGVDTLARRLRRAGIVIGAVGVAST